MFVKQVSVFLENSPGRLLALCDELGKAGIDLISLNIADTADFGILRAITSDTERTLQVLRDAGFTANVTEVLAVFVPDRPGGLASVLRALNQKEIGVEYLYSFVRHVEKNALLVFRVERLQEAYELLVEAGFETVAQEQLSGL